MNEKVKSHIKQKDKKNPNVSDKGKDMPNYGNIDIAESRLTTLIREVLENLLERDYKAEYEKYHSKPEQKKRRAQRNKSRRKMEREGKVKKGSDMDVHHKNHDTSDQSSDNLAVVHKSKNRADNRK